MVERPQMAEWTSTVIDIAATSRLGGGADTAVVDTVARLAQPPADPLGTASGDTVEVLAGDGLTVRLRQRILLVPDGDVFTLDLDVPPPGLEVAKGGSIRAVALLPVLPGREVRVESYEPGDARLVDGDDQALLGGRPAVTLWAEADPRFIIRYIYG